MHIWRRVVLCIVLMIGLLSAISVFAQDVGVTAQAFRTVSIRQGPGTNYDIIGQLQSGDTVTVIARSDDDSNWLRVQSGVINGWIAYFTVTVSGDVSQLEIIDLQPVNLPAAAVEADPIPFVSAQDYEGQPYVTTFRRINVRVSPSSEFGRLGFMNPGNVADLTGRTDDNEWLQIDFNGQRGWVAFFVVSVTGDVDALPIVAFNFTPETPVPTRTPTPAPLMILVVTRFNSNLRAAPDFSAPILTIVPFNSELQAEARTADNNWLRITIDGQTGWLITSLVTVIRPNRTDRLELLPVAP